MLEFFVLNSSLLPQNQLRQEGRLHADEDEFVEGGGGGLFVAEDGLGTPATHTCRRWWRVDEWVKSCMVRQIRRFQVRSLHTIFPCNPKKYCLQNCLGDLVLIFHVCGLDRQAL